MTAPIDTLTITRPDDWHLHVRDGDALHTVAVSYTHLTLPTTPYV